MSSPAQSSHGRGVTLGLVAGGLLKAYPVAAHALPPHDVQWAQSACIAEQFDLERAPEALRPLVDRFRANDIIEVDERLSPPNRRTTRASNVYRTKVGVAGWVERNIPVPDTFPCGHPGMRNLGDDRFTCRLAECDEEYDRATASAVFGRGSQ